MSVMLGNTLYTLPTRGFVFILDPACLSYQEIISIYRNVFRIVEKLKQIEPGVNIEILFPSNLATQDDFLLLQRLNIFNIKFKVIDKPCDLEIIRLDESIPEDISEKLKQDTDNSNRAMALLSLSESYKSDGIITTNDLLLEARYPIYQHHTIRIVPLDEFPDIVDIIAHGNSIFLSTSSPWRGLSFDTFYQLTHYKNWRFFKWFEKISKKIDNSELIEDLRSAFLNRYPYILYSRDMIRFYELQMDHYSRRGDEKYGLALGYYLTIFYMLLWGMLDQLTLILKQIYHLNIDDKKCGIQSKTFWNKFSAQEPRLDRFIKNPVIAEWIEIMAEMRHHAAHKAIKIPRRLLIKTKEAKIKQLASRVSVIKTKEGTAFIYPSSRVDYDLERMNAVIDAFLTILFEKQEEGEVNP